MPSKPKKPLFPIRSGNVTREHSRNARTDAVVKQLKAAESRIKVLEDQMELMAKAYSQLESRFSSHYHPDYDNA